jgi:hypothetical protein
MSSTPPPVNHATRSLLHAARAQLRKAPARHLAPTDHACQLPIAAAAIEQWRSAQPDLAEDFDFRDRYLKLGLTFGGADDIRGDLPPECTAAVTAVMQALGKMRGQEDGRSEGQRFHDTPQLPWVPMPRVCRTAVSRGSARRWPCYLGASDCRAKENPAHEEPGGVCVQL